MHHIAVLDDVFLAFEAHLARFLGALFAVIGDEILIADHFGADEAFFKIGMNDTGCLRRGIAFVDGPGADFFDTGGEVGLQSEQFITRAHQTIQPGFFEVQVG